MPLLLLLLAVAVYLVLWHQWRTTTLDRHCRWRLDRSVAPDHWRCVACRAEARGPEPKDCLRARRQAAGSARGTQEARSSPDRERRRIAAMPVQHRGLRSGESRQE